MVKGAAANLMCENLRSTAANLEIVAKDSKDMPLTSNVIESLETQYEKLKEAAEKYKKFVKTTIPKE